MNDLSSLTSAQFRHAADLKEKISALENELASILGSVPTPSAPAPDPEKKSTGDTKVEPVNEPRRKMSAAGRARIPAAQKTRWAKTSSERDLKQATQENKKIRFQKPKRKISAEGRAKMAAAAKARWAKAKTAGKTSL